MVTKRHNTIRPCGTCIFGSVFCSKVLAPVHILDLIDIKNGSDKKLEKLTNF